ncbi:hypothetical protein AAC387_Pa06g3172 [Persea americana]
MKSNVNIEGSWEGLSEDEAWDLLRAEATDIANSLATSNIDIGGDALMQCYTYLFLFLAGGPSNEISAFWKTERLIGTFESWERMAHLSLLSMLQNRAMILGLDTGFIHVSKSIVSKVVPILNRQGRCLVRHGLELEEAPKVDEWEKDNLKRISLACSRITVLGQVGRPPNVPQLSTLILFINPLLQEVSDDFFYNMQGLRVLDLSLTGIKSLPSSLSTLTNLRLLALSYCPNLETLPIHLLHSLQNLEALLLQKSPFPKLTQLSLDMMQHLYLLDMSGASNLTQLSLRGCRSFEMLFPPKDLEILDLSSTKISEFDYFGFWHMTRLRRLDLLDTKHLNVVPWHKIHRLPQTLNWDHCSIHSLAEEIHTNQGYCISVSDDEIFESLSEDSKLWKIYFRKFRFSVVSCDQRQQQQPKDTKYPFERTHFIYRGIYEAKTKYFTQSPEVIRSYDRCLEIGSTNDVPYSIRGVLYHTEFLSLCGNNSIIRLSQLGVENMDSLIECRLEKCLNMQHLVTSTGKITRNVVALSRIEILLIFDLTNLKSLCRGTLGRGSFACLKHMCLEHCHRLSTLFSSSVCLEKLEKLEIKFCYKLESLFEEAVEGQDVFPQLKELYLLKLPKLKCICNGNLPALEKLKAHGCQLLQKLPLPTATGNKLNTVVISGCQEWKRNLKWEEQLINQGVKLKVPRAFKV